MIDVAIVGGATGREHCLVREFHRDGYRVSAIVWDRHRPIEALAHRYAVHDMRDADGVAAILRGWAPDLVVVNQAEALFAGIGDRLRALGIRSCAPSCAMARIESGRAYARRLLDDIDPAWSPRWRAVSTVDRHLAEIARELGPMLVLKCEGATGQPRVAVFDTTHDEAAFVRTAERWIGRTGRLIVEEWVDGDDLALVSFTDGDAVVHAPPFRNYKRVGDGDTGAMTSGMGSVAGTDGLAGGSTIRAMHAVAEAVLRALRREGHSYVGCVYAEFRIDRAGAPKVIELNCRLGNPSTLNLSSLSIPGLPAILQAIACATLGSTQWSWRSGYSVSAYVVPKNYTTAAPAIGAHVDFSECDPELTYVGKLGGTADGDELIDARALAVCARGETRADARARVYGELEKIRGPVHYRRDIGAAS